MVRMLLKRRTVLLKYAAVLFIIGSVGLIFAFTKISGRVSASVDRKKVVNAPVVEEYDNSNGQQTEDSVMSTCAPCSEDDRSGNRLAFVPCTADGFNKRYQCVRDSEKHQLYFPFSEFLRKRFDVNLRTYKEPPSEQIVYELLHSDAKVRRPPLGPYDPMGTFGSFGSYSVENRNRVACISAQHGIPMSVQWSPTPYFYPIQIAQYGLQHYSRNLTDEHEHSALLVGGSESSASWHLPSDFDKSAKIEERFDKENSAKVLDFTTNGSLSNAGILLLLNSSASDYSILDFQWLPHSSDASFTITVQKTANDQLLRLHYVAENGCVRPLSTQNSNPTDFVYGLGKGSHCKGVSGQVMMVVTSDNLMILWSQDFKPDVWRSVVRDALVDAGRAVLSVPASSANADDSTSSRSGGIKRSGDIQLVSIAFRGRCSVVQRVLQRTSAHVEQFLKAADWFVAEQDEQGGWSVPVERSIADKKLVLNPGWHSAMAQGHAISVLVRAYGTTNDKSGGVLNNFLDTIPWYEEYPTTPGSFVLNGFIYSLIGLYDLANGTGNAKAAQLYRQGLSSLKSLLPLYDTGSGSVYDLRHVSLKTPPNLARWDYHTVHIYQLLWLFNIEGDQYFNQTAERWIGYMHGKRAKHN